MNLKLVLSYIHQQKTQSKYLELDAVVTKEIIARERLLVTRASVLQTRNKKAFSGIMDAAMASLKKDEQRKREEQQKKAAQNKAQHSYDRYGEVAEDKFWKDRLKGNGTLSSSRLVHCCRAR